MGRLYSRQLKMSTWFLFQRHKFRHSVNIPTGLSVERKSIVLSVDRPWAFGLSRLLADRRLKKGDLAELAGVRPGTISAVANSPKAPDVSTLQRLADGLTQFDRRGNPAAPTVELWEFFVTDEQAALLRESASKQQQLVSQDQLIDRVMSRLAPLVTSALQQELHPAVDAQALVKKRA